MLCNMISSIFGKKDDTDKFGFLDVVLGLLLIGGIDILYLVLPRGVVVVIWLFVALWIVKRRAWASLKKHRYIASAGKAADRLKTIINMSDSEFEEKFGPKDIPHTFQAEPVPQAETSEGAEASRPKTEPFMPSYACKQTVPIEEAMRLAIAWWEQPDSDNMTGAQRIEDLIQQINVDRSTTRTAILNEYADSLLLPKDEAVLMQLVEVAKVNGLGAELSADGDLIIQWGQDDSGREAGDY